MQLHSEYDSNAAISQGFDSHLFSEHQARQYQPVNVTDPSKVFENCSKMSSVLSMIDKNLTGGML